MVNNKKAATAPLSSIFVETPDLSTLTHDEMVIIEIVNFEAYILKRLHAEVLFYVCGVCCQSFNRVALYHQTITHMLETAIDLTALSIMKQRH